MKKIMLFLLLIVIMATVVYAPNQEVVAEPKGAKGSAEQKVIATGLENGEGAGEGQGEMEQVKAQAQLHTGLENALGNVENENARQKLQQNMERFQEHYQARLENMEGLEVEEMNEETGEMRVSAREEVRFLGFIKGKAKKSFEIDGEGDITEKHPWYKFLYREAQE